MKLGRLFAIGFSVSLLASLPAVSAVKAGSTCKKVGQTSVVKGKTYTCIKSGKQKVWSKGAPIKTASPVETQTPAPNPNPTRTPDVDPSPSPEIHKDNKEFSPWSTDFKVELMYKKALENTKEFFAKTEISEEGLSSLIQDTFPEKDAALLKSVGVGAHSMFYPITKQKTTLIYAISPSWAGEQARKLNLRVYDFNLPCGGNGTWDSYCAVDNVGFMIYNGRYEDAKKRSLLRLDLNGGSISVVAHEYFHTVQKALIQMEARDPSGNLYIPIWLYEGSANFIGFATTDYLNVSKYETGRFSEVESHQDYKNEESKVNLENFRDYSSKNKGVSLNPYGIGMAATEYIVASVGIDSLLNIFRYTKESKDFSESFLKATGITIEKFYELFELARPNMAIGTK